jgi:hypothetical protein
MNFIELEERIMMKQISRLLVLAMALLMTASITWAAQNQAPPEPNVAQGFKQTVNFADLPQKVRQAIANTAPEDSPVSAEKISRDGEISYLIVTTGVHGKHVVLISENGEVLKRDIKPPDQSETKAQTVKENINVANIPPAVLEAVRQHAANGKIESAHRVMHDGQTDYMVVLNGAGGKQAMLVSENGTILKKNVGPADQPETKAQAIKENINPADLPLPVLQAVRQHASNGTIESARRVMRDGQIDYLVVLNGVNGKQAMLVSENGTILKKDVNPEDNASDNRAVKKIEKTRDRSERKIEKTEDRAAKKDEKQNNQGNK